MSSLVNSVQLHPRRWALIVAGIGASALLITFLTRRGHRRRERNLSTASLLKSITGPGYDGLNSALKSLEKLLHELEAHRYSSDVDRDRYNLIASVLVRLRTILSDLQCFERNEFEQKQPAATETIARAVWNTPSIRAGTLSVLSDDSFLSAKDEFQPITQESFSISIDHENQKLYQEGLALAEKGQVNYRKSRAELCGCESDIDFAAKLWCIRQAFDVILADQSKRRSIIQAGRNMIAGLLRQDRKDPKDFYVAYDKLIDFVEDPDNYIQILTELNSRNVEHLNVWDVLFDFVLLDSFDDLRKPPSGIAALVKNSFLSRSMRESTLTNIIWSLIKVKRARLLVSDGFVSHFYDLSQIVSPTLTLGLLGGSTKEFENLCLEFKENVLAFVVDLFNPSKTRYTTLSELTEDVGNTLFTRLEAFTVRLSNEDLSM
ncbi:hypothetical protein M3Y97_00269600 [Aphelenchoides bicaudatus]|nr:hypothetical protein M3Y97_00269600 [Aphelenchoides bicaudatus]